MEHERRDLLAMLMPISRDLRRAEDAAAGQHGLTMWQYAILSVVDRRAGMNQAEVAGALDYSRNRIVADLDRLEEGGLLARRPGQDRRANVLEITDAGRRTMRAIRADIHRHEDELVAPLSASTLRTFVAALRALDEQVRVRR